MCEKCQNPSHLDGLAAPDRRKALFTGVGLAAAPILAGMATGAEAQDKRHSAVGSGPYKVRAYGVTSPTDSFKPIDINRRALRPDDVLIDIMYSAICHSDIHIARQEWGAPYPATNWPCVPGHEMVGRIVAVGKAVKKFQVGDYAGVGCLVDSCGTCDNCKADLEQYCVNGWTLVFNSADKISGGHHFGGYSERIVVQEHWAVRIPPGVDLAGTAPLLCAGITTFSPMQHWKVEAGQKVGVIGLGGLGHMAVKLGVARKADVIVFTTTPGKIPEAKRLGASDAVLHSDTESFKRLANQFDFIISTVPRPIPMHAFGLLLKLDGTLVNVGAREPVEDIRGSGLWTARRKLSGSLVGGMAETQQVVDYCAQRNITADIELIQPHQIDQAFDRVKNKDVRFRFVIDMTKGRVSA